MRLGCLCHLIVLFYHFCFNFVFAFSLKCPNVAESVSLPATEQRPPTAVASDLPLGCAVLQIPVRRPPTGLTHAGGVVGFKQTRGGRQAKWSVDGCVRSDGNKVLDVASGALS